MRSESLNNWFLKHSERGEGFVSLYDMMFESRSTAYLIFRLRLFNLQVLFRFMTHAFLFYLLFSELTTKTFSILILFMGIKMLLSAAWWGALETLRTEVRYAFASANQEEVERTIGFWMSLGCLLALGAFGVSCYYCYQAYLNAGVHPAMLYENLFIAAIFLMLSIQLPVRAYHSGIFAISRVMRPGMSMIVGNLFSLAIVLVFWKPLQSLSIPLALVVGAIASNLLSFYYTKNMYHLYKISIIKPTPRDFFKRFFGLHFGHTLQASLANVTIAIDSLLILAFFLFSSQKPALMPFLFVIFLISPLIRASSEWARMFYFDRKRLGNKEFIKFIRIYNRTIGRAAAIIGAVVWMFAVASVYGLISPSSALYTALALPFFILRSKISNEQIESFTSFHYFDIIFSGAIFAGGVAAVFLMQTTDLYKVFLLFGLSFFVLGFLKKDRFSPYHGFDTRPLSLNFYAWLSKLNQIDLPTEVYVLKISDKITSQQMLYLNRKIAERVEQEGNITLFESGYILFYRRHLAGREFLSAAPFAILGAGLIEKFEFQVIESERIRNRKWTAIREWAAMKPFFRTQFIPIGTRSIAAVQDRRIVERFLAKFPDGTYYDPVCHLGKEATPMPLKEVRSFLHLVTEFLFKKSPRSAHSYDVSALFNLGEIDMIFVIPKKEGEGARERDIAQWHDYIHDVCVNRALDTTPVILDKAAQFSLEKTERFAILS